MNHLPKLPPMDNRNPPAKLTKEKWAEVQQVKSLNVLAATPEQLKEAFRKL